MPAKRSRRWLYVVTAAAVCLMAYGPARAAFAQDDAARLQDASPPGGAALVHPQPATTPAVGAPMAPEDRYGAWVLAPPLVTILLAIALRQVIPALTIGILVAAFMMLPCLSAADAYGGGVIGGIRLAAETYLVGAIADVDHVKILLFSFVISGMVGVVSACGGTAAVVAVVARWASTRARGQLATWFAGLVVFFDDYANAMIVGPSMRPVCERLRISRAKLAYIVDSTAAPVASIALIGTWVGTEISYIDEGLQHLAQAPAFLDGVNAYSAFLKSIPYRFYAILALVMVFFVGLLGRDFGPMKRAEQAAPDPEELTDRGEERAPAGRAWYAVAPLVTLIAVTLILLATTGWPAGPLSDVETRPEVPRWVGLTEVIISKADPYNSLLYSAFAGIVVALGIAVFAARLSLGKAMDGATDAMARIFPTFVVLVLAWALSGAMRDLHLGQVAVRILTESQFEPKWLPLLIFVSACIVSFATGTSWGTMGILCPATVTISAGLYADLPAEQALPLFYAAVGAVLAGAVFGDHCSPISDTTVLSSLATGCSLEEHVWTQFPYALIVALVSILCGDVLCRQYDQPWWVGMLAGAAALFVIVLVVGRKPKYALA